MRHTRSMWIWWATTAASNASQLGDGASAWTEIYYPCMQLHANSQRYIAFFVPSI